MCREVRGPAPSPIPPPPPPPLPGFYISFFLFKTYSLHLLSPAPRPPSRVPALFLFPFQDLQSAPPPSLSSPRFFLLRPTVCTSTRDDAIRILSGHERERDGVCHPSPPYIPSYPVLFIPLCFFLPAATIPPANLPVFVFFFALHLRACWGLLCGRVPSTSSFFPRAFFFILDLVFFSFSTGPFFVFLGPRPTPVSSLPKPTRRHRYASEDVVSPPPQPEPLPRFPPTRHYHRVRYAVQQHKAPCNERHCSALPSCISNAALRVYYVVRRMLLLCSAPRDMQRFAAHMRPPHALYHER